MFFTEVYNASKIRHEYLKYIMAHYTRLDSEEFRAITKQYSELINANTASDLINPTTDYSINTVQLEALLLAHFPQVRLRVYSGFSCLWISVEDIVSFTTMLDIYNTALELTRTYAPDRHVKMYINGGRKTVCSRRANVFYTTGYKVTFYGSVITIGLEDGDVAELEDRCPTPESLTAYVQDLKWLNGNKPFSRKDFTDFSIILYRVGKFTMQDLLSW